MATDPSILWSYTPGVDDSRKSATFLRVELFAEQPNEFSHLLFKTAHTLSKNQLETFSKSLQKNFCFCKMRFWVCRAQLLGFPVETPKGGELPIHHQIGNFLIACVMMFKNLHLSDFPSFPPAALSSCKGNNHIADKTAYRDLLTVQSTIK